MAVKNFTTRIKLKTDIADNWSGASLILLPGEFAFDSTNNNFKIGDGSKTFAQLSYVIGGAKLAGWTEDTSSNTAILATDTLETALHKLENKVNAATTGGITDITMNGSNVTVTNNVAALGDQVTTFGGQNGAITLGTGLQMGTGDNTKQVSAKVVTANGLSVDSNGIKMALADGSNNGAMSSAHYTKLEGIEAGAEVNVLEGVQVNGTDLTIDANKKVNVTIAEGATNGTIAVNGTDVAVHGLGSAAYQNTSAFEAAFTDGSHNVATMDSYTPQSGEIATQKIEFFDGTQSSGALGTANTASETLYFKSAVTAANPIVTNSDLSGIVGAMVYKGVVNTTTALPTTGVQPGWTYVVSEDGTYAGVACETGDMIIAKDSTPTWNVINGENQVTNAGATITAGAGTATTIATVDGTDITAQVSVTAGSATIASKSGNTITLNTGVTQGTNTGTIANTTGDNTTITLADVAATGAANELTVTSATYGGSENTTNAQTALTNLATAVSNINTSISDLDATNVQAVTPTAATSSDGAKLTFNGITQTAGQISQGSGATELQFAKVATTGAAEDVSLADSGNHYTATTVEGAFEEIAEWLLILDCGSSTQSNHTA